MILCSVWFVLSAFAKEPEPKPWQCPEPKEGPAWFQDLTPEQQSRLRVKWKTEGLKGRYEISGKYKEPQPQENRNYKSYDSVVKVDLEERWECKDQGESNFSTVTGNLIQEIEWKALEESTVEEQETENRFEVRAIDKILHVGHESEHSIQIKKPGEQKELKEKTKWNQVFEEGKPPVLKGTLTSRLSEKYGQSLQGRNLASPLSLPTFSETLTPGTEVSIETEQQGTFNGPAELASIKTDKTTLRRSKSELEEQSEFSATEERVFDFNPKTQNYFLVNSTERSQEKSVLAGGKEQRVIHKEQVWKDLEKSPVSGTTLKQIHKKNMQEHMSLYSIRAFGKQKLPSFLNLEPRTGTLSRVTEFHENGEIARFYVVYFPEQAGANRTKLDLGFNGFGRLQEFIVDDGSDELAAFEDPFTTPAALKLLQQKVALVKELERNTQIPTLKPIELQEGDYPNLRLPPPLPEEQLLAPLDKTN